MLPSGSAGSLGDGNGRPRASLSFISSQRSRARRRRSPSSVCHENSHPNRAQRARSRPSSQLLRSTSTISRMPSACICSSTHLLHQASTSSKEGDGLSPVLLGNTTARTPQRFSGWSPPSPSVENSNSAKSPGISWVFQFSSRLVPLSWNIWDFCGKGCVNTSVKPFFSRRSFSPLAKATAFSSIGSSFGAPSAPSPSAGFSSASALGVSVSGSFGSLILNVTGHPSLPRSSMSPGPPISSPSALVTLISGSNPGNRDSSSSGEDTP
mmetsp:Transcript_69452/g.132507  ORF Transcript_69452/g.132507 Transcript_69452/m.132507 type:complete len:267 (+) Transcript_69452:81-881(+)